MSDDVNNNGDSKIKPSLDHVLESIGFESLEKALESKLKKIKLLREEQDPNNEEEG